MGYFPNGTAGMLYQEQYCDRCIHDDQNDCPIWNAHLMFNGKDTHEGILEMFIPRDERGENQECRFFQLSAERAAGARADQLYLEWKSKPHTDARRQDEG